MKKYLLCLAVALAACGDDGNKSGAVDARVDSQLPVDSAVDGPNIDAPDIDAPDAMRTPGESITDVRDATDGPVNIKVVNVTVTYLKPQIGSTTNDPAGFTVQADQMGPALMVAVDPATTTPALVVGDVISFTVTTRATVGGQPRATAITDLTRASQGANVTALAQNLSASTDLVTAIDNYDSEISTFSGTVAGAFSSSGAMWEKASITTAGITVVDPNFQLRLPATLRASSQIETGCTFTVTNTPVGRFTAGTNSQTQLTAFVAADIVVDTCPAPTVVMAVATDVTAVKVVFSRPIDAATATATAFSIVDAASATLAVSAAAVSADGFTVTLTTAAQTPGTTYTVTAANTVKDTFGTVVGTPDSAMFVGFTPAPAADHLVINEVDYDQDGGDTAEFVEIFNPTSADIDLTDYKIYLVNGGASGGPTGTVYFTGVPTGTLVAGGYLVIKNPGVVVPAGTPTINIANQNLQNGPSDGIAIVKLSTGTVVDAFNYPDADGKIGSGLTTVTLPGVTGTVSLVEGMAFRTGDTFTGSVGRFPNGKDTNDAKTDWALLATPTPGAANQ